MIANLNDPRWDGYVPWFLRSSKHFSGDWSTLFSRLSQRLNRLMLYNETDIPNVLHFMDWLETESLQRFTNDRTVCPNVRLSDYFKPETLRAESKGRANEDDIEIKVRNLSSRLESDRKYLVSGYGSGIRFPRPPHLEPTESSIAAMSAELKTLTEEQLKTHSDREQRHYRDITIERLSVLETLLRIVPAQTGWSIAHSRYSTILCRIEYYARFKRTGNRCSPIGSVGRTASAE